MKWRYEEIKAKHGDAWRVLNDDNDVEFMCADHVDARYLTWYLNKALDMHVPRYGYEKEEFKRWKENEEGVRPTVDCRSAMVDTSTPVIDKSGSIRAMLLDMADGDANKAAVLLERYITSMKEAHDADTEPRRQAV